MNETNSNMAHPRTPGADANRDPITKAPGAHPVGTGLGAIGTGAAAGAAGGAIGGPVGAIAGAAVGAVVGGLVGKAAAEAVNPTVETEYWREHHESRPYAGSAGYDEYEPAYRYGWENFNRRGGRQDQSFESVESDLQRGWDEAKGKSGLPWEQAKAATRDAWNRVQLAARSPEHSED